MMLTPCCQSSFIIHPRWVECEACGTLYRPDGSVKPVYTKWCVNHPTRKAKGRGLCPECYYADYRAGGAPKKKVYADLLIDDLETRAFTWTQLENKYGTRRANLQRSLRDRGRKDLIRKAHLATYGATNQADIVSVARKGRPFGDILR